MCLCEFVHTWLFSFTFVCDFENKVNLVVHIVTSDVITIGPFTITCTPITHFDDTYSLKLSGKFIEPFEVALHMLQDHGKIKQISTNFLIKMIHVFYMFAQVVFCYINWFHNVICYFFKQINYFSLAIYKIHTS